MSDDDFDDDFTMSQAYHAPALNDPEASGVAMRAEVEGTMAEQASGRVINDDVWGHLYFKSQFWDVIDTEEFQRLRDLKQLGTTYYVYPGATHNRFEHSLGVCYLGMEQTLKFRGIQRELELNSFDINAIGYAGLCHDLGHGPFSHVFENEFLKRAYAERATSYRSHHEEHSVKIWERLIDKNNLDIESDMIKRVSALIESGLEGCPLTGEKTWLGELIANGRNSVDVDKIDYLKRDAQNCNVKISCDLRRLIMHTKVIDNEICFKSNNVGNLYQLFHDRGSMHDRVYTHKKGKAVEYMIVDALLAADRAKDREYSNSINDMEEYLRLDDTLLRSIELERTGESDSHSCMREAQDIIKRIRKRDLYKYVHEYVVPTHLMGGYKEVTAEDIIGCQKMDGTIPGGLRPEDIIVQNLKIDYCKKDKNP
eukprot:5711068-Pyramimonas_sp.AAC.1